VGGLTASGVKDITLSPFWNSISKTTDSLYLIIPDTSLGLFRLHYGDIFKNVVITVGTENAPYAEVNAIVSHLEYTPFTLQGWDA
jgi:hypothetical protein